MAIQPVISGSSAWGSQPYSFYPEPYTGQPLDCPSELLSGPVPLGVLMGTTLPVLTSKDQNRTLVSAVPVSLLTSSPIHELIGKECT